MQKVTIIVSEQQSMSENERKKLNGWIEELSALKSRDAAREMKIRITYPGRKVECIHVKLCEYGMLSLLARISNLGYGAQAIFTDNAIKSIKMYHAVSEGKRYIFDTFYEEFNHSRIWCGVCRENGKYAWLDEHGIQFEGEQRMPAIIICR